jgi:hypothetical protein
MNRTIICLTTCCLLFTSTLFCQINGKKLFDNNQIHKIELIPLYQNLYDTLIEYYIKSFDFNNIQIRDIPYAPAKLVIDDILFDTVGVRCKGFNSWWNSSKKPLKIDLNKYKPDQQYDGLKKINLHNSSGDPSFIRENLCYKMLNMLGINVPRTAYAKVYIDTAYLGLYRLVEQVDNAFLDVRYGNHDGNLFVCTNNSYLDWMGNYPEFYNQAFSLENHQSRNDWSGFIHFIDVLNNTPDKDFRDSILTVFDVDEFLQILAFDIAIGNLDFYGFSGRNFYLYSYNGIFHWIPWDYNLTWRENGTPLNIDPIGYPILIRRILQVPEFYQLFMEKFCRIHTLFSDTTINELIAGETAQIWPNMLNDPFADYPNEALLKNIDSAWNNIPGLKPFVIQKDSMISKILYDLQVDCQGTEVEHQEKPDPFQLCPNPADVTITIYTNISTPVEVTIYSISGLLVSQNRVFALQSMDVSQLKAGCYVVKVQTGKAVYSKLLMVHH